MEDYAIIYNPISKAGKSKKDIEYAKKCLDDLNVSYKMIESESEGHAIELAEHSAKDGYRVIAAGGDGTCNEILNGVINSKTNQLCGFIPMGSGNDIPGAIGIKSDIKRACEIIADGFHDKCDIGFAKTDLGVERYFLGIGSQGFDAEVTYRTNSKKKRLNGTWNYVSSVITTIAKWKSLEVTIKMDNDSYSGLSNCIAVGNGPSYGGWMYICQQARINDGKFHISIVNMGKFKLLFDFKKMYSADLMPHPNIHEFISKKVRIEMKNPEDTPYICQVDGEVLGKIPVDYEVLQNGYEFIMPQCDEVAEDFKQKHGRYFYEYSH